VIECGLVPMVYRILTSSSKKASASRPPKKKRVLKTLDRILSKSGVASRTDARKWIAAGRVQVNGELIQTPDKWVDPERDRVTLDGRPLVAAEKVYLLLYKPKGYLTTYRDPEGRPTVYDLLHGAEEWVSPVGRLDQETSGLLILTNDTDFANFITSPESKVPKTYLVKTSTPLSDHDLDQLRHGLALSDGPTRPAIVRRIPETRSTIEITITEGRNRQVRRMVDALSNKVRKLVRIAIGPVRIDNLEIGKSRPLSAREVQQIRAAGQHIMVRNLNR
jgi:23S rRNA pseudouridine2605 synthase